MGEIGENKIFLDSVFAEKGNEVFLSLREKCRTIENNPKSTLFSRGERTESFFTEDSKLYVTPKEQKLLDQGIKLNGGLREFDGASSRIIESYRQFRPSQSDILYKSLIKRYTRIKANITDIPQSFFRQLSLVKLWNLSIIGAIIIGMISMTFIYRYFGMGASAVEDSTKLAISDTKTEQVLGAESIKSDKETVDYIASIMADLEKAKKDEFEKELRGMVKGYPIEKMLPYILEKDRAVAAFLVGIAKKESGWGQHVPVLNGQDCYNYWGYRGQRALMGTGGHTCFNSRKDAVDTVAKRLEFLIEEKKLDTPAKMIIWKCGSACSKDNQAAVRKWISDVDLYFQKLN